jgi:ribonuclease BN (tRNA processing enzyme)
MKWTVLGCQSPYPGPGGATPGYLLSTPQGKVLIDCGSGVVSQLGKYVKPWEVDAIVLSHLHHDHAVDIPIFHYSMLMAFLQKYRVTPMPIFSPQTPVDLAQRLPYENYVIVKDIQSEDARVISGARFDYVKTQHGLECYAMKIRYLGKTICYTADTGPETNWSGLGTDMDLLIVEGTYLHKDLPSGSRGHLSVSEAAQLASSLRAKRCMITHLYPMYDKEEIYKEAKASYDGNLYLAEVGLEVEV